MTNPIPKHCAGCDMLWTGGVKDGKHDRWCCQYGKPAAKAVGHCKNVGGKKVTQ
jgi:hypothetical protein